MKSEDTQAQQAEENPVVVLSTEEESEDEKPENKSSVPKLRSVSEEYAKLLEGADTSEILGSAINEQPEHTSDYPKAP